MNINLKGLLYRDEAIFTQMFGENPEIYKSIGLAYHNGVDIAYTGNDSTLIMPCSGQVTFVGYDPQGYGNYVKIWNKQDNVSIIFAHFSKVLVSKGQELNQGDEVGIEGSTGFSTGSHCHFQINPVNSNYEKLYPNNGVYGAVDPIPYLEKWQKQIKENNMSNKFHIQDEDGLNNWLLKNGIQRLRELGVNVSTFHLSSEEELNNWIKKFGKARLLELGEFNLSDTSKEEKQLLEKISELQKNLAQKDSELNLLKQSKLTSSQDIKVLKIDQETQNKLNDYEELKKQLEVEKLRQNPIIEKVERPIQTSKTVKTVGSGLSLATILPLTYLTDFFRPFYNLIQANQSTIYVGVITILLLTILTVTMIKIRDDKKLKLNFEELLRFGNETLAKTEDFLSLIERLKNLKKK
jgi:Peptidase family M23